MKKALRLAVWMTGFTGIMLSSLSAAQAADGITPSAKDFAGMAQCKALQTKYPSLVGKKWWWVSAVIPKVSKHRPPRILR
ncbi:hypothetical protein [Rouxiella chamberiensis]|uniref:Uncharacterized protein n=1 Tax=Rouxiella chamberiensis TaxID=1513468 RepID=A0ABY7HPN5_9GAMM|nr:hypothetical protein [Rouxiella chamberiensis]WAT01348.1 hypothetical protein O1V66_00520 [Rouxiella chamberiensis]